eukprot:44035-Chlamydomonas_euryale.AAC.1
MQQTGGRTAGIKQIGVSTAGIKQTGVSTASMQQTGVHTAGIKHPAAALPEMVRSDLEPLCRSESDSRMLLDSTRTLWDCNPSLLTNLNSMYSSADDAVRPFSNFARSTQLCHGKAGTADRRQLFTMHYLK